MDSTTFIGIDLGTSGCRACLIDADEKLLHEVRLNFPDPKISGNKAEQDPEIWWQVTKSVLTELCQHPAAQFLAAISVDATSSTVLVTDGDHQPLSNALMYNDTRAENESKVVESIAPKAFAAVYGSSSSLSKSLWLVSEFPDAQHILHQADYIVGKLSGEFVSDYNNCLKLGFDPIKETWPDWFCQLSIDIEMLPKVFAPGTEIGQLTEENSTLLKLRNSVQIIAGTTDSIAGFLATGASALGDSVTSLGSTLVIKTLSDKPINSSIEGIYSHRINNAWLVGGASNCGTAVLRKEFDDDELQKLSKQLNFDIPTGLKYYPLLKTGERFPINDPRKEPCLTPHPNKITFLQAVLESLTSIEKQGYEALINKGALKPKRIFTVGGGTINKKWMIFRSKQLDSEVIIPEYTEACYGTALLAKRGYTTVSNT